MTGLGSDDEREDSEINVFFDGDGQVPRHLRRLAADR